MGQDAAGVQGPQNGLRVGEVLDGAVRGAVGAMAMTGMRVLTTGLGLVEETLPQGRPAASARALCCGGRRAGSAGGWSRSPTGPSVPAAARCSGRCPAACAGAAGRARCTGLAVWLGFELGIAPALGLSQAKRVRAVDRLALAADHLLYGLVLSGTRRGARD